MKQLTINLTENAHPHAEMIAAKAADMSLSVLVKMAHVWVKAITPVWNEDIEYFLCLPKHKDAVLNILNGGESEVSSFNGEWDECNCNIPTRWSRSWWYMRDIYESRIKPKKEKRWVRVQRNGLSLDTMILFDTKEDAVGNGSYQAFEIEVEVTQ